jgi:hypothetical protein
MGSQKVFISFSHGTPDDEWTTAFVKKLISDGIDVTYDERDLPLGADTVSFMSRIQAASRVLIMCTEKYVDKIENPQGGVGFENSLIAGELMDDLATHKFIPVICPSNRSRRRPGYLRTRRYVNFSVPAQQQAQYEILLRDLRGLSGSPSFAKAPEPERDAELPATVPLQEVVLGVSGTDVTAGDSMAGTTTSAIIVTDEWKVLSQSFDQMREDINRNPLIPAVARQLVKSASLGQLLDNVATRRWALEWLSITPFSAYVSFGNRAMLQPLGSADLDSRFFVEPLFHRLSRKSQRIVRAQSDVAGFDVFIATAIERVRTDYGRTVDSPRLGRGLERLVELAGLVARATSAHLDRPEDLVASETFESLRTRIRFAQDLVTGQRHTRDENPLP